VSAKGRPEREQAPEREARRVGSTRALPRILVTGASGQLGFELARTLAPLGDVIATDRAALDLADADAIVAAMRAHTPAVVVNAAAYTAVDQAERDEAQAHAINAIAPGILAEQAHRIGALLVHYSTDYVFDGRQAEPYAEDAPTNPVNAYGRSKLAGEQAIAATGATAFVFRTSWVYADRGRNFLLTMRRLAGEREEIRVVDDQRGTPNWSRALARATSRVLTRDREWLAARTGVYNMTSTGATTWFGFAQAIIGDLQQDVARDAKVARVLPINTAQYPTPAARPANSVLDDRRFTSTFGFALPAWQEALAECLSGMDDNGR
jgi:dTDP-4-dehydrorhamnose reductase